MKLIADTNLLVRFLIDDDPSQSAMARAFFVEAELAIIPVVALCEAVWVLSYSYKLPLREIAEAIRQMTMVANVRVDRLAVDAGLAILDAGALMRGP